MKKFHLLFLAICLHAFALAENDCQISILTCSPGDEIYSVFGHTCIRVKQPEAGMDLVFNFGTFDFSTNHFAFKFAKGTLLYCLDIQPIEYFVAEYNYYKRSVVEQTLNLTDVQEEAILRELDFLYQPENRYYRYAFIEKNCATEIRDILKEAGVHFEMEPVAPSERDLIESYLARHKWLRFGINLALGRTIDKPSTTYRSMFLPDYLHDELKKADQEAGNVIAKEEVLVNGFTTPAQKADWWCSPFFIFSLLFAVSLFVKHKAFTVTLFSIIGLTGLVLLVLNIFSLHVEVKQNFNILWCNPLYLIYLPFIIKNRSNKFLSIAFLSTIVLTSLLWITGFQVFDRAIVPVLLMLAARLIVIIGNEWKTARNTVV